MPRHIYLTRTNTTSMMTWIVTTTITAMVGGTAGMGMTPQTFLPLSLPHGGSLFSRR
jgi:hypothetical protein